MAYPKPLSEKSLARLYQQSGISKEQSEYLHSLFQACANLYGAVQLRVVWDVYQAQTEAPKLRRKDIISFSENLPYQLRNPFIKSITDLSKNFPFFNKITIEDINLIDSLFSILYSPLKCSKPYINYTSFVVYYQFTKEIIQDDKINKINNEYDKQTITGVLPIKINTNLYFQRIIIFNFVMNISPLFNYFSPYFNDDTIMIKNMAYAVINDVSKHIRGTSYDYDCFMKLSKHNSINEWK